MLERFVDEMLPNINFSYLRAQSSVTSRQPNRPCFTGLIVPAIVFPEYCYLYGETGRAIC